MTATTSGQAVPATETVTLPPAMAALQKWRDADHEDAILLTRDDIITLIEEARAENARLRADAQAAVAMVGERAASAIRAEAKVSPYHNGMTVVFQRGLSDGFEAAAQIVAELAPVDGLAMVETLRKERDDADAEKSHMQDRAETVAQWRQKDQADLAAAQAQIDALRGALVMAKQHMIVNDLSLPNVFAVIDAALSALPAKEGE